MNSIPIRACIYRQEIRPHKRLELHYCMLVSMLMCSRCDVAIGLDSPSVTKTPDA